MFSSSNHSTDSSKAKQSKAKSPLLQNAVRKVLSVGVANEKKETPLAFYVAAPAGAILSMVSWYVELPFSGTVPWQNS